MRVATYYNQKKRKDMNGPQAAVIRYDEENGKAPVVVASGKGQVAQQIIELAQKNNIHMQEDSSLVANLLDMDLGENIPPQLYSVMAEILLLIEEMEKNYS
ncbi:EscU/YscU/HrcU family type III secretion system export apparatus switch protein [Niallia endozanthoxylica]|uniref:Flagellar biosynthesis protein FlhS n=1 Tax=Niallia endozanthoxylica TaxID=2036016 RepID=A0A5J5HQ40_9BACI|nr:EscU/YscU/HrcU family type III secretion system export apparatus switch protein [Niallia endozanthoxylica]KAA9022095.1 flagellar biosynthesis protein FlhS [Niallia endozanthoxylica]